MILLARAGAVAWDFSFSGHDDNGDPESDAGWLTCRLLRGDHQTDHFWQNVVESTRAAMAENSRESLRRLRSSMTGIVCTGVVTAESFAIDSPPDAHGLSGGVWRVPLVSGTWQDPVGVAFAHPGGDRCSAGG